MTGRGGNSGRVAEGTSVEKETAIAHLPTAHAARRKARRWRRSWATGGRSTWRARRRRRRLPAPRVPHRVGLRPGLGRRRAVRARPLAQRLQRARRATRRVVEAHLARLLRQRLARRGDAHHLRERVRQHCPAHPQHRSPRRGDPVPPSEGEELTDERLGWGIMSPSAKSGLCIRHVLRSRGCH